MNVFHCALTRNWQVCWSLHNWAFSRTTLWDTLRKTNHYIYLIQAENSSRLETLVLWKGLCRAQMALLLLLSAWNIDLLMLPHIVLVQQQSARLLHVNARVWENFQSLGREDHFQRYAYFAGVDLLQQTNSSWYCRQMGRSGCSVFTVTHPWDNLVDFQTSMKCLVNNLAVGI